MPTVAALWRYPVKSLGGERCQSVALDARGVVDDRRWALRTAGGRLVSGKTSRSSGRFQRVDGMLEWSARLDGDSPVITTPTGDELHGDQADIDTQLSARIDQPITFHAEDGDPHFDKSPVHVLTTASLRWLQELLPDSAIDERRFRPNVVVDVEGTTPVEASWIGRDVQLGSDVVLRVVELTERCVMTTLAQFDLPKDPTVLRAIAQHANARFGVYADVVRGGTVTLDDRVTITD